MAQAVPNTSGKMFSPACFHPVKNSAMVHAPAIDTMPLVECPVRLSSGSRVGTQNPHTGVVVVHHAALRRLPDQLFQHGAERGLRSGLISFPLCGCQGAKAFRVGLGQSFQPLEWHCQVPYFSLSDHPATAGLLVPAGPPASGSSAVKTSPQKKKALQQKSLHLEHGRLQRRVAHEALPVLPILSGGTLFPRHSRALVAGVERWHALMATLFALCKRTGCTVAPCTDRPEPIGWLSVLPGVVCIRQQNRTGFLRIPFPKAVSRPWHGVAALSFLAFRFALGRPARGLRSMIWSSSSRFTSPARRIVIPG